MSNFSYASNETPDGYKCGCCGAHGVRLYREYNTFLEYQRLYCRACAVAENPGYKPFLATEHSIGRLVAAVPLEDGSTFWGYTSVPQDGVAWWDRLPKEDVK